MTRTELLHPMPRRDAATVLRSATAAAWLLVRRRARRDAALLVVLVVLVCAASFLAALSPRLVIGAVDDGARDAVARAGSDADVVVHVAVGKRTPTTPFTPPAEVVPLAESIPELLPDSVAAVYSAMTVTVLSPEVAASVDHASGALAVQVGMLTPAITAGLRLVDGDLPSDTAVGAIEVLVSTAANLPVGSVITPESTDDTFVVVGVVESADEATTWRDLPTLFTPDVTTNSAGSSRTAFTLLTSTAGVVRAESVIADPWDASIRLVLDPASFTGVLEEKVAREINGLRSNGAGLGGDSGATVRVNSDFSSALIDFQPQARASVAQMSVMFAGMLGVAAIVVVLLSRLIVSRRSAELLLERARGASLVATGVRAAIESLAIALVGSAAGYLLALLLSPTPPEPTWVVVIAIVTAVAIPVQSVLDARGATVRRVAANRGDRMDVVRRAQAKRLVIEITLVAIAAAALVSVRSRGLLQTRTDGIDPLLAAAPLLLAVVVTIVLLRVFPLVIRLVAAAGRRSAGALGILGAAHAERAIAVLPLASLTLAVALAVGGGLLVDTVHSGQVDASWQRVGADVRVTGAIASGEAARIADEPGVTAASALRVTEGVTVNAGSTSAIVSVLAVDDAYADLVAALPAGGGEAALSTLGGQSDALPAVVDASLAARLLAGDLVMSFGTENIPLTVVGTVDTGPDGWVAGPHVYVDLAALNERLAAPLAANTLLVVGETTDLPDGEVITRSAWVSDLEQRPLIAGVRTVMAISAGSACLFAIFALLASVLGSARSRGRSLALLRTLGMGSGLGWWIALAELAPLVVLAAVGGILSGLAMVLVVGPSLGLQALAGGLGAPTASLSPVVVLAVAAGLALLLLVAIATEAFVRRRDRLSDVLRVGETV